MKRNVFLDNTPLGEALERWNAALERAGAAKPLPGETVAVEKSRGRVTAAPVTAAVSSPSYHAAAMDGYAVRFADTFGATETRPKRLAVGRDAFPVDTGDPLPEGCNAVVMIEHVQPVGGAGEEAIEIIESVTPWHHVRTTGEDIVATEMIVPENHVVRPVDIGAMLGAGITEISVRRRPRVAVIPTGDELIQPGEPPGPGRIFEFNSRVLCGLVEEWGGEPVRSEIVRDNVESLRTRIGEAASEGDLVVVNAGSSAGSEDYTVHVLRELGEVVLHGVSIKPGKPVILALVSGKPVLGIPGYPVSTVLTFELFGKPLVFALQGRRVPPAQTIRARMSRQTASPLGQEEFLRVKVGRVGENIVATPISRGAGVLMSLVRADGIVRIPAGSEGVGAGAEIDVALLRPAEEISKTVVCIGSHDNTLDLLANALKKRRPEMSLSSAHVGSLGGLLALKRGEAHVAGTHLLDEETGTYNVSYLRKILPDRRMTLIRLVDREQGFVVPRGNPMGIKGFGDLARPGVVYINRQAGSGTRLLLDHHLKKNGIDPGKVTGYGHEEYTHMGVAAAVLSGVASTGLAILAAARALGLDFVPVAIEEYDLAIPREFLNLPMVQVLLEVIRTDREFKDAIRALGGYGVERMGEVVWES
ncbi:MAG: molybdopterin biosynthesis protein [Nitrospirae bacterium RBG_16_64_22]|nr:MAG: molybdopterin biosynthesis protein [Nitrospirae bacterium RBG_16_64_22]